MYSPTPAALAASKAFSSHFTETTSVVESLKFNVTVSGSDTVSSFERDTVMSSTEILDTTLGAFVPVLM